MKTLFVNPNNRILLGDLPAIEPPLWLSLMVSHYLEDGRQVTALDAEAENLTVDETANRILAESPGEVIVVVMGNNPSVSSTPKMKVAVALARALKPHVNVSLTGLHPMAVGSDFPVIHWRPTKCLPLHWELLPMSLYRAHNWHCLGGIPRSHYASTYTSLGCPFDCYYCNIHTLYKDHILLRRGLPGILSEIDTLVTQYEVKNLKLWDELFAINESRVLSICSGLQDYNLNIWAYARVDTVTPMMLRIMKKAGINWLAYGFESSSSDVRESTNKHFGDTEAERAIKMTRDAGINIIANFMFGLPGETEAIMVKTLEYAEKQLFEFVNFYTALPYPGSKWYEDTKPENVEFDQYARSDFKQYAFRHYFSNPVYLSMIKKKFGTDSEIKHMFEIDNKVYA